MNVVSTIAELKAVAAPTAAVTAFVLGYYAAGDGGDGFFRFNVTDTTADNGGTVIAPNSGSGRWNRVVENAVFNVRHFGAKGDANTNDTARIQAAVDTGADVYFPPGTYMIEPTTSRTDPVLSEAVRCAILPKSNQKLLFSSGAKLKAVDWAGEGQPNDDGGSAILCIGVENVVIEGGVIEGNWANSPDEDERNGSSQHGIHIATSTNVTVKDTTLQTWWADGWTVSYWADEDYCHNSRNINFINVHCTGNRRNGASAVGLDGGSIIGGKYANTQGTAPFAGIDLEPNDVTGLEDGQARVRNVRLVGVQTTGNEYGIVLQCTASNIVTNITISGCTIDDGLYLYKTNFCSITGNVIKNPNNDPDTSAALSAIRLIDADYNNVGGNVVTEAHRHGIEVDANSNHNNVSGNHVIGNSQHTTNTYSGVYVAGDFNHVSGNKIHKGTGAKVQKYGIEIVSGALSNHVFASDLDTGGQTANYIDGSGSSIALHYDNTIGAAIFGADTDIKWGKSLVSLAGGAAPILGTIGSPGPSTAAQNAWVRFVDNTGAVFWVPAWK